MAFVIKKSLANCPYCNTSFVFKTWYFFKKKYNLTCPHCFVISTKDQLEKS